MKQPQYVFKSAVSRHLICPVCTDVIFISQRLFCGHIFCQSCLQHHILSMKKNGRPPTCPIDREVIDESMMHRDMICEGMLGLLVVYCTNRPNSCKWEGKQKDLEAHCRECTYKDLPQWLSRKVTIQKLDNDMFLLDDEIAEKIEREAPDVDLYTRVYFKNQSLVGEVMGKIKNVYKSIKSKIPLIKK